MSRVFNIERLRQMPGYNGRYFAYDDGTILGVRGGYLVPMSTDLDKDGYPIVYLSDCGSTVKLRVHRIIAELFVTGRSEFRSEVDHIDGKKRNARAGNLEWVSRAENMRRMHARRRPHD